MNKKEITRKLNSVGQASFVEHFETYESYSNGKISKAECIELLVKSGIGNESGSAIRCSNAKLIFEAKQEISALEMVAESKRLTHRILEKAKEIINQKRT